jgi:hypothetical protein
MPKSVVKKMDKEFNLLLKKKDTKPKVHSFIHIHHSVYTCRKIKMKTKMLEYRLRKLMYFIIIII